MTARTKISVGIITKNRLHNLIDCIQSIVPQLPDEIIVVDSTTDKNQRTKTHQFLKKLSVAFQYIYEPKPGFSTARNNVLRKARHPWVAFIDDDCLADPQWISSMKSSITAYPHVAAIVGRSETAFPSNPFALAARLHELQWKLPAIYKTHLRDLEVLDTKNIVFRASFLASHHLQFDTRPPFGTLWPHDDIDFGMQIAEARGKARWNPSMIIYHKDAHTLRGFWKKTWFDTYWYEPYRQKWRMARSKAEGIRRSFPYSFFLSHLYAHYTPSFFTRIQLRFVLAITSIMIRIARIYASYIFRS
jgi:glycosyltransferase involved in cell wall biosynthesis